MIAIAIYDEPGDPIGLGPDDATKSFIQTFGCLAEVRRLLDATCEEIEIEILTTAGKATGEEAPASPGDV